MLTSPLSALRTVIVSFAACASTLVNAAGNALDQGEIQRAIAIQAGQDPTITEVGHWKIEMTPMKRGLEKGKAVYLIPFRVTYSDATNAYCRVATWAPSTKSASIIPVPDAANFDTCGGFGDLVWADLNGDGLPDLLAVVHVHSNTFEGQVDETAAYLSTKNGFCYSSSAAKGVGADEFSGPRRDVAVERIRRRHAQCD